MAINTISTEVKIAAAKEVFLIEQTGKTKKQIAEEFSISTRSLNRYFDQYKDEIESEFSLEPSEEVEQIEAAFETKSEVEEKKEEQIEAASSNSLYEELKQQEYYSTLSVADQVILAKYFENKALDLKYDREASKVGRTPKGTKPTRDVIMEVIEKHLVNGTLTKANKIKIAEEISEATGHGIEHSKFMFSKLKKLFGASKLS